MKIIIKTNAPAVLEKEIFKKTKDEELETWTIVNTKEGLRLSHNTEQFFKKALLGFKIINKDELQVEIWWYTNEEPTNEIKGIYLGRFVEALLNHFNNLFEYLIINKD